ncbi:cysteine-tryptophan domain-containing zinc finger protein 3-like isoform X2 [Oryza brachyantha]|uniref:cysteine-tryptophan domain-containing zinc finger protein 3-like isoform X2 n=1 Tax=Oryza brachyantha TaxID=4533 RepID=UPI0007763855|nr:cysteine-tryptophan domain-containing zinc finger protein 3-like isoform X2 [Oryza brachyantha]
MLSVRGRQEGFRGGSGAGAMDHDVELEEGEACPDDDGTVGCVDPDVELSYIDEKLQHVLGHFQKDFEGGVSAENLGSKFGGYGSFLPTYQRSPPPLPQSRSPPKVANIGISRSPYRQSTESMDQYPSTVAMESISRNNGSTAPPSGDLCKKEICSSTNGEKDSVACSDSLDSSFNGSDQKTLKVRLKVSSTNTLTRKNAAIYSGLGLDISSSSSMEGSPDGIEAQSPEFSNMPYESPRTILQIMTYFSVPGGFLLSPLHGNILKLTNKVTPLVNKWETNMDLQNVPRAVDGHSEHSLSSGHVKGHVAKKMKHDGKKKKSIDTKTRKDTNSTSAIAGKEANVEIPSSDVILSDTHNIPGSSGVPTTELKGVSQFTEKSIKDARSKQQIVCNDLGTVKSGAVKIEATKHGEENSSFDSSGNGSVLPRGKVNLAASKVDRTSEDLNITSHRDSPYDRKKESKVKPMRTFEPAMVDFEGNDDKDWDAGPSGPSDNLKIIPGNKTFASDRTADGNSRSEVKRLQKDHKANSPAPSNLIEDGICTHSSVALNDGKIDSHSKSNHFENKSKARSHKDLSETLPKRYMGNKEEASLDNISVQGRQKEKMMDSDNEKEFHIAGPAKKEIPSTVKHGIFPGSEEQQLHLPSNGGIIPSNAASLPAPVVIEDKWVCCDLCHKWRLLPYGTNTSMLPEKWKCSMLDWLPGMNRCDISEDETTNALNALYVTQIPATGISSGGPHTGHAGAAASSTYNIIGQLGQNRKRKNALKDENCLVENSYLPAPASVTIMSNQRAPAKNKEVVDSERYPNDSDFVRRHELGPVSKSADHFAEKQKSKHKSRSSHFDGDLTEKSKKHSKSKNRRGNDREEHKTSKKTKKDDRHYFDKDWENQYDLAGNEVHGETKAFAAKVKTLKDSCERGEFSLQQEKASRYDILEKPKRNNDNDVGFHEKMKEPHADTETLDLSGKKKIVKEWEDSRLSSMDHTSKGAENENLERMSKIKKFEARPGEVRDANALLSSAGGRLNNELVADNKFVTCKESPSEPWENQPPRQVLNLTEPTRRDVACHKSSTVATSSSSKVSSSRRNKNSQETKGSPVESVSSSPVKNLTIDKISKARDTGKDGALNADSSVMRTPVKYPSNEVGFLHTGKQAKNTESKATGDAILRDYLQGCSDGNNKRDLSTQAQISDFIHLEKSMDSSRPKASGRMDLAANNSGVGSGDNQLYPGDKKILDTHSPTLQPDQRALFNQRATADSTGHKSKNSTLSRQGRNGSSNLISDGNKQIEMSSRKEKSRPRIDNQDMQKPIGQDIHSHRKEGKLEVHTSRAKSDASKNSTQSRPNVENGVQHGTMGQAVSNPSDSTSPIRRDGNMVAFALKEARDLKHKANHLKDKGLELESMGLYFEAALKFLHVASLLETPNLDNSRSGDAAQSMKMYSETAKLCSFCAHAYERCKKMASAALAYKCVEVAYLKAAYYKHPSANKDRQELQSVLQTGESPSSSASDIDNLNSHGLSKVPSTKDGNSPQVAGNHLPLAVRNQAHLLRLLAYTNDINCAFDATRKSQVAIASAVGSLQREKVVDDGLASVRTVLDFNFNNVNELLRLVRLSMESISS